MKNFYDINTHLRKKVRDSYAFIINKTQKPLIEKSSSAYITIYHDYEGEYAWPGVKKISYRAVNRILDIEKEYALRATYNVVGKLINDTPMIIKRIIGDGHELASHSYSHEILSQMSKHELEKDIEYFKQIMKEYKITLNGIRSPQSKWSHVQMGIMLSNGLKWSAENDKASYPYIIKRSGEKKLVRMPIKMDDWNYKALNWSADKMLKEMLIVLDKAVNDKKYASFGFHPWVLGEDKKRMAAFERFIEILTTQTDASIVTFNEMADNVNTY